MNKNHENINAFDHSLISLLESEVSEEEYHIFKRTIDAISEGVVITRVDADNAIIYVNSQFLNETGYTKEEMLGRNPRFLQGPDTDPKVLEKVREAIQNKVQFRGEIINYRKDGSCFHNLMTINPVFNENNQVTHFVGLQSNINYRIQMEKDLELSNQRFELAVKATKDVIRDWNFSENTIHWENSLKDIYGYSLNFSETSSEWFFDRIHPDDRAEVKRKLRECLDKNEKYWEDEYRFLTNEDKYKNILDRAYIIYDDNDRPLRMISAMQDLTSYKKLLNEQINLSRELSHYNKDLQQFGYILSHNLRGSIASIKGLVNVLQLEKYQYPDDIQIVFKHLNTAAQNLDKTITDLVGILQVRSTFNELNELVCLTEIFNQVLESLQDQIDKSNAHIEVDFTAVPQIKTIKSYLVSILYNLVSNAMKYRSTKRDLLIQVRTYFEGECIILEVTDNGLGIDLEQQKDKVFGLYKRFHPHIEGKGMGLYLVKNQVESLGGTIKIKSEVDVGTTFKIYLKNE